MLYYFEHKMLSNLRRVQSLKTSTRDKIESCPFFEFSFFLVSRDGVRLSGLGTSDTIWPVVLAPDDG
jgi:hypothetical protein